MCEIDLGINVQAASGKILVRTSSARDYSQEIDLISGG
jgi:hypothetical protein